METKKTSDAEDLSRVASPSLRHWQSPGKEVREEDEIPRRNVSIDMGWGRLLFGHTFEDHQQLADTLAAEEEGKRDIAFYLKDPHVILALAPQQFFLDPSHTYRLWLQEAEIEAPPEKGFSIRRVATVEEAAAVNTIYSSRGMVPVDPEFVLSTRESPVIRHLVAVDDRTGQVLGTITAVDHKEAFDDPEQGSSLWCLAVSPQAALPGIGRALVQHVARTFREAGRAFLDLSVLHDNQEAISLYEGMGFQRVPAFCVKRKNPYNEPLYMVPEVKQPLNPYAEIIVNEARQRGINVEILDGEYGYFALTFGGRRIVCREALTELTTAIAMSRCDHKVVSRRILQGAGLRVPDQRVSGSWEQDVAFLEEHGAVVVKPARGEQGEGVSVDVRTAEELEASVEKARRSCNEVVIEELSKGEDLRVIVIDHEVVAAAVRRPARVVGTGRHTVRELIERQSRRRMAATGGESRIPMDEETERSVRGAGWEMEAVLPEGESIRVRKTANLHTGGTIHDVTAELSETLREASTRASRALDIPVVGLDFLVPDVRGTEYVVIEANERPGLANHEPQPTAERFVDMLFPSTVDHHHTGGVKTP